MWWFVKKSQGQDIRASDPRVRSAPNLLALVPDMSEVLEGQDVAVKIWLPEVVARTVKWLADYAGQSQSAWLRELLLVYVYGRAAWMAHKLRTEGRSPVPMFSRSAVDRTQGRWVYLVPQLGKNEVAFKLWLSTRMQADLCSLAEHAQTPLSAFVREAIVADLLGRGSLPERPEIMGRPSARALAWERGEQVPVRELAPEQFHGLGEAEYTHRPDS